MINRRLKPSSFEGPDVCPFSSSEEEEEDQVRFGPRIGKLQRSPYIYGDTSPPHACIFNENFPFSEGAKEVFRRRRSNFFFFFFSYFVHGRTYLNISESKHFLFSYVYDITSDIYKFSLEIVILR